jgi:short-subunit dehydrogenase
MTRLRDRRVLLTGASQGIGPFIAAALAGRGCHVALTARSEQLLREVAGRLDVFPVDVGIFPCDLLEADQRRRLIDDVLERFGRIDILVNNAGVENEGPFLDQTLEAHRRTIELNLLAPIELTHALLPIMLEQGNGHIVNIASVGAKAGSPYDAVYCGSKAGLAEWTRGIRLEKEHAGIRFSTIFPGFVSEVGMFARFGLKAPWTIGSCTPQEVAAAVVKALEHNRPEIIVNSRPLKPLLALAALSPRLAGWLMHRLGVVDFQRRKVGQSNRSQALGT